MNIEYRNEKDLPCDELYNLFLAYNMIKVGFISK